MAVRAAHAVLVPTCMRGFVIVAVLGVQACARPDVCTELATRLAECGIDDRGGALVASCEAGADDDAEWIASATCDDLFAATASFADNGKADDGTGGLCLLSSQCGPGLVCRPDNHFINRCQRPGLLGEHCWTAAQCANGMSCHAIWHDVAPVAHPARVCNPHQNAEHRHQAHDDLPGHVHTTPARLDPTRSYKDRVTLITLLRDRHPYPFHGTGEAWADHRDGLLVQTLWQDESQRDVTRADGLLWSWWGNINWTLTMWQAEVLQRYRGELRDVTIVRYTDPRFDIPPDVVTSILELYDAIDETRREAEAGRLTGAARDAAEWRLQRLMWRMHDVVLAVSLPRNDDLLAALPDGEREFATSWKATVELLTESSFPTNYTTIRRIQRAALPHRMVRPDDYVLTKRSDLLVTARATAIGLRQLGRFEAVTGGSLAALAGRYASTRERAQRLGQVIEEALVTSGDRLPDRLWAWLSGA